MIIEKYSIKDYKIILNIQKENMANYTIRNFGIPWKESRFKNRYNELLENGYIYSIKEDSKIIGFFMLIITNDNYLHIKELQIDKQYQGKGFGSKCLKYIDNIGKDKGVIGIRLTVFFDNPAIKLYKRTGFRIIFDRFDGKAYFMEKKIK